MASRTTISEKRGRRLAVARAQQADCKRTFDPQAWVFQQGGVDVGNRQAKPAGPVSAKGTFMKRFALWVAGIVIAMVAAVAMAFYLSPWPSAFVIAQVFSVGDTASEAPLTFPRLVATRTGAVF